MAAQHQSPAPHGADSDLGFWDHVDQLRAVLWRMAAVWVLGVAVMFAVLPRIFSRVIMAPCSGAFATYGLFDRLAALCGIQASERQDIALINIKLASQFGVHAQLSLWLSLALTFPVLLWLLWRFVAPGLYKAERRSASAALGAGTALFYLGVAAGYFLIFPLALRFLADYQLSPLVPNTISLDSYIDNLLMLTFLPGLMFELPVAAWLLGRMGLLHRGIFRRYRRHAVVALLVAAAVITPTGDPLTMLAVFLPLYLLWEGAALTVAPQARSTNLETQQLT